MINKGYISLFRKIQDHWIWDDKPVSKGQAWVDMLLWASHRDREVPITDGFVQIKTGEFIRTLRQMGEAWGWSKNKVSHFLKQGQDSGMITIKTGTKATHVSIINYESYRNTTLSEGTRKGQERDKQGTTKGHNKELKRIKKNYINGSAMVKPYAERVDEYFKSIKPDLIEIWNQAYPNIDIPLQLGIAKSWLISNPNKAKKDFNRFVNNWLAKAMEMPRSQVAPKPHPNVEYDYHCTNCETKQKCKLEPKDVYKVGCKKCGIKGMLVRPWEWEYTKK